MGLRQWVKGLVGKTEVKRVECLLRPDPCGASVQSDSVMLHQPIALTSQNLLVESINERIQDLNQDQIDDLTSQAVDFNNSGQFDKALVIMDEVLSAQPSYGHGWHVHGYALDGLEIYDKALESYNKATEFQYENDYTYFAKGRIYSLLGRQEESIYFYKKVIESNPNHHNAWSGCGKSLYSLGRDEEAMKSFDRAIEIEPDNYETFSNRGIVLSKLTSVLFKP